MRANEPLASPPLPLNQNSLFKPVRPNHGSCVSRTIRWQFSRRGADPRPGRPPAGEGASCLVPVSVLHIPAMVSIKTHPVLSRQPLQASFTPFCVQAENCSEKQGAVCVGIRGFASVVATWDSVQARLRWSVSIILPLS